MELKQLMEKLEELGRAHEEFKTANDARLKQLESKGSVDPLLETKVNKANVDLSKIEGEITQIKVAMARSGASGSAEDQKGAAEREAKSAFHLAMRKGMERMSPEEMKALSVDSQGDGGFLVRAEMSARIISKIFESSPLRQLAAVQSISSDALEILADLGEADCGWVGERGTRSETNTPGVKMIRIPAHEIYAEPKATQKVLDDAEIDLEAWLQGKVTEKFARTEASAFINGTGVLQPRGILKYAHGTTGFGDIQQVNMGAVNLLTSNGLLAVQYALKAAYSQRATWLMKRATVLAVRQLKNTVDGQYMWQPGLTVGQPSSLLNSLIMEADDMPVVTASALAVAYGDFKEAYQIVDRIGVRVLRDPFTSKGFVKFYTTKRTGGDVVNFEALKIGKVAE